MGAGMEMIHISSPASRAVKPLHLITMHGLGDNIYHRPFVRAAATRGPVSIETPWPEVYQDLGLTFVQPATRLRTQQKNVAGKRSEFWSGPLGEPLVFRYASEHLRHGSITGAMERVLPLEGAPFVFDLPDFGSREMTFRRPLAVMRPATVRSEWANEARNPRPEYLATAAQQLRAAGYFVISVADLETGLEWLVGEAPEADLTLHAGELRISDMLWLIQNADLCVGGVGWIAPAAIAAGTPLILIAGGQGAFNAPEHVTDPRMNLDRVRWLIPNPYCRCKEKSHACEKRIPGFAQRFARALEEVTR